MLYLHLKLRQPANFEPVDLKEGYIRHLKVLKEKKMTQYMKIGVEGQNIWRTL